MSDLLYMLEVKYNIVKWTNFTVQAIKFTKELLHTGLIQQILG